MAKSIKYVVAALLIVMLIGVSCSAGFFGHNKFDLIKPKFFMKPKLGFAKPAFVMPNFGKQKFFKKKMLFG